MAGNRLHVKYRKRQLAIERMEARRLLTAAPFYIPTTTMWTNGQQFLTGANAGAPIDVATQFLEGHASRFGLTVDAIRNSKVTDQYTDADTGITHIYLRQQVGGLEVQNTSIGIHLTSSGEVITASSSFVPVFDSEGFTSALSQEMRFGALDAALSAMAQLDLPLDVGPNPSGYSESPNTPDQATLLRIPGLSLDDIQARLVWIPNEAAGLDLSWEMVARTPDGEHWYHMGVDASTGELRMLWDWVEHATYNVLPIPTESPADGSFELVMDPHTAAPMASPFGWHDTNGVAGAEFTTTIGNNVDAHLDRNGDDVADAGSRPDGGAGLNFNATFNPSLSPAQNANVAVTNLFYWNNVLHDVHYLYGFTPAAGNFQTNTYFLGGLGNDAVQADAQDAADNGSGNNAFFGTPPDGTPPRMLMYEFTATTPRRDSALDSTIITHEYGHGVSNRLTGGPANASALNALQSGGMGEGWSDWWSLMFRQSSATETLDARGVGMYVLGQPDNGIGIRNYRYDFDIANQPLETFLNFGTGVGQSTQVHATGTRWSSTLWDLNHLLIQKYGYEPNIFNSNSSAGNIRALRLVMEALKLQPANPSFVQARDAILAADTALNGGNNHREIWTAFARRGLGEGATTLSASSSGLTTSFTIPAQFSGLAVSSTVPSSNAVVNTPLTSFTVNLSEEYLPSSIDATDFTVNSLPASAFTLIDADTVVFTFAVTPLTTQGVQNMSMAAGNILSLNDSSEISQFNGSFIWDSIPLDVASTSPAPSSIVPVSIPFVLDINFNEPIDTSTISLNDLSVSSGSVASAIAVDTDTARYTIINLTAETLLNVTFRANRIADPFGNPNLTNFVASYVVDRDIASFPQAPTAILPLGSLAYENLAEGIIGFATDVDGFIISLDTPQTLSVLVTTTSTSLRPRVEILDPANNSLVIASSASNGSSVLLPPTPTTTPGVYRINVSGLNQTVGEYGLRLVLNSGIESESAVVGVTNNVIANAEDLAATSINLGSAPSQSRRMTMVGGTDLPDVRAVTPSFTDISTTGNRSSTAVGDDEFDTLSSGQLSGFTFPFYGTTYSSLSFSTNGLITFGSGSLEYLNGDLSANPTQAAIAVLWDDLNIDNTGTGTASRAIFWQVVGSSGPDQRLIVQWNNVRLLGGSTYFTMQAVLYADGTVDLNYGSSVVSSVLTSASVGLKAAGTSNPSRQLLHLNQPVSALVGPNLSTRFTAGLSDFYKLSLVAGDRVSLAIRSLAVGSVVIQLIGSDGATVLASGIGPTANLTDSIQNFAAPGAGTYFVRISSVTSIPYSMVLTVNAAFDAETNNSFETAQPIFSAALGALDTNTDEDWYALDVVDPASRIRIQTATPSDGSGEFLNTLNPTLELFSPDNVLIGAGIALADGRNESISVPLLPSVGIYRIRMRASGVTRGEYSLSAVLAPADITISSGNVLENLAAGATVGTLAVADANAASTHTYQLVSGTGSTDNDAFEIVAGAVKTKSSFNFESKPTYLIRVRATDQGGSQIEKAMTISIVDLPELISGPVIGDGTAQRSIVNQLVVTFDQAVTIGAGAFVVTQRGGGVVTSSAAGISNAQGQFVVTITFSGVSTHNGALNDGYYQLNIDGTKLTRVGQSLDINQDGTGGDSLVIGDDEADNFFAMFGDTNGDGLVGVAEFGLFRSAFGKTSSDVGYSIQYDFDGDGVVGISDFGQFRSRFGKPKLVF